MKKIMIIASASFLFMGVAKAQQDVAKDKKVNLEVYSVDKARAMTNTSLSIALTQSVFNAGAFCTIRAVNYVQDQYGRVENAAQSVSTGTYDKTPRQMNNEILRDLNRVAYPPIANEDVACSISINNVNIISDVLFQRGQMTAEEKAEFDKMEKPTIIAP